PRLIDRGRKLRTTAPAAFLMLYCVAGLRRFRRRTLRHAREMRHLDQWAQRVQKFAASDLALATAVCEARRLVGGYSDTHSRGESKFDKVMLASERLAGLQESKSHGGSTYMHGLKAGDRLTISPPANNFPLGAGAGEVALVAGGIGVTPLLTMACELSAAKRPFSFYYAGRSRSELP